MRETGARERDWVIISVDTGQAGARDERVPGQSKEQEKVKSTDGTLGSSYRMCCCMCVWRGGGGGMAGGRGSKEDRTRIITKVQITLLTKGRGVFE